MTLCVIVITLLVFIMEAHRISDSALRCQIKQAHTIQEMLHTYYENANHLNNIYMSACWISLATLAVASWAEQAWLKRNVLALEPLGQHTI